MLLRQISVPAHRASDVVFLRRKLACASLWEYCLLKNTSLTPCPIPALSLIPRQKPLCVEELWGFHNGGTAMLAKRRLTLPLTVGMWQSILSHTRTHTHVHARTCALMHRHNSDHVCGKVCEESWLIQTCSRWRIVPSCYVVKCYLWDFRMITCTTNILTPFQMKYTPVSELIYLWNELTVLFLSPPHFFHSGTSPLFSLHSSVYTETWQPGTSWSQRATSWRSLTLAWPGTSITSTTIKRRPMWVLNLHDRHWCALWGRGMFLRAAVWD